MTTLFDDEQAAEFYRRTGIMRPEDATKAREEWTAHLAEITDEIELITDVIELNDD